MLFRWLIRQFLLEVVQIQYIVLFLTTSLRCTHPFLGMFIMPNMQRMWQKQHNQIHRELAFMYNVL